MPYACHCKAGGKTVWANCTTCRQTEIIQWNSGAWSSHQHIDCKRYLQ
uniref:Uncharacterized protein n=1 Tax=Anguilla anguilla TaxID=7936 RepID=A0A0E9SJQ8_ANGAN